jgi:SNF2 family DNA or RNA helicase
MLDPVAASLTPPPPHPPTTLTPPQFLGMLDIVAAGLRAAGIPFVRLDGRCSAAQRADMLERFRTPGGPRVFLASLKAGGVGM